MSQTSNQDPALRPIVRFLSDTDLLHHVSGDSGPASEVNGVLPLSISSKHSQRPPLNSRRRADYITSNTDPAADTSLKNSLQYDEIAKEAPGFLMARTESGHNSKASSIVKGTPDPAPVVQPTIVGSRATLLVANRDVSHHRGSMKIPFWMISCCLMSVPLIFVTTYLGISLNDAIRDLRYTSSTADAVGGIFDLQTALISERFATTSFFAVANGTQAERDAAKAEYVKRQEATDHARSALRVLYQDSSYATLREDCLVQLRRNVETLETLRYGVGAGLIARSAAQFQYTTVANAIVRGLTIMSRDSSAMRLYLSLRAISLVVNYLGMCRSTGMVVLLEGPKAPSAVDGNGDASPLMELATQCAQPIRRTVSDAVDEADGPILTLLNEWLGSDIHQEMMGVVFALEESLTEGSTYFPPLSASNYTALATSNVMLLLQVIAQLRSRVQAAEDVKRQALVEALKMCATLVLSCVAIGVVGRAQGMATKRVDLALNRTDQMAKSVQAFIPQDFLSLMQVESILKLERGDRRRVRIAMLFCDIRNFTGISERMSNEQLFDWLQAHLMAMARTTERHGGFVDKFIGDAVSSVFLEGSDAVRCAVSMQAATDALCFDLIASNQDHMVRIGVGVHFGEVEVGVLGNEKHLTCAIISPEVNVAAQLEAATKVYGSRILISEPVMERLPEGVFSVRALGEARLSADAGAVSVFDVYNADPLPLKQFKDATAAEWDALLAAQKQQRFDEASKIAASLQRRADAAHVSDPALGVKLKASQIWDTLCNDQPNWRR